jgi:hypothetical protein
MSSLTSSISAALADRLFVLSNIGLVVGATLALVGTIGTFWTGGIRDRYADERFRQADVRVAEANASAAAANERAAQSEKAAALANFETIKLRKQVSWRQLTEEQEKEIGERLQGSQIAVQITWVGSDAESGFFAESIRRALQRGKIAVSRSSPAFFGGDQPQPGLSISGPPSAVSSLIAAFEQSGVKATMTGMGGAPNEVWLLVGPRPPLEQ